MTTQYLDHLQKVGKRYKATRDQREKDTLKKCILVGLGTLLGITVVLVALGTHAFPTLTSSREFIYFIVTMLLLWVATKVYGLFKPSHMNRRCSFAILTLFMVSSLTYASHLVTSPRVVLLCLFASLCIVLIAAHVGFNTQADLSSWMPALIGIMDPLPPQ